MATYLLSSAVTKTIVNNERFAQDIWKQTIRWNVQQQRKTRGSYHKYYGRMITARHRVTGSSNGLHKAVQGIKHDDQNCIISTLHRVTSSLQNPSIYSCNSNSLVQDKTCYHPVGFMNEQTTVSTLRALRTGLKLNAQFRSLWTSNKCFDNGKIPPHSSTVAPWKAVKEKKDKFREAKQDLIEDIKETKALVREKMDAIIERENIWTVPNLLCISRIACSPLLCYLIMSTNYNWALGLFVCAGITDLLDGLIARMFPSQASRLGSFLDPLADKVLVALVFLSLTYVGLIPLPLTMLIIYRDVVIIAGASYVRFKSLPPPRNLVRYFDATHATAQLTPTTISKINTAIQLSLITASLAAPVFGFTDHYLLKCLWLVTGVTTLASGISYIFSKDTYKILRNMKKPS